MPSVPSPLALAGVLVLLGWSDVTAAAPVDPAVPSAAMAVPAQADPDSTFADPSARALHEVARAAWRDTHDDLVRYTAVVKQRMAAQLRTPLKDRTVYRAEAATRVFWDREGSTLVQVLAADERYPYRDDEYVDVPDLVDQAWDPSGERIVFGFSDDISGDPEFWFVHPLAPEGPDHYRYAGGDTVTVRLPDGRALSVAELSVLPRTADPHTIRGSLWIEPESGALVRAAYRLARPLDLEADTDIYGNDEDLERVPGLFKPFTFDLSLVVVEYALWDFSLWLPRAMRVEGIAAAGVVKAPATVEISYAMESVVTEDDLAREASGEAAAPEERRFATRSEAMAWLAGKLGEEGVEYRVDDTRSRFQGREVRYLVPEDPSWLAESPHLPPPVWEDAPGFPTEDELEEAEAMLAALPLPAPEGTPTTFYHGLQRPDLARYNRVEGLSLGARVSALFATPLGPVAADLTGRLGHADLEPRGELALTREDLRRRVRLSAYHELAPVSPGRFLELGNSVNALLFGRDDGDWYQATGVELSLTPPAAERQWIRFGVHAEHQHGVERNTDLSAAHLVDDDRGFRPVLAADPANQAGASLLLTPWWGSDPSLAQAGVEARILGETGDFRFARAGLVARGVVPVTDRTRVGVEAGAGTTWGDAPRQRSWLLGGPHSLRGYGPATLLGPTYVRARGEVSRTWPFGAVALFGDWGWAGEREAFDASDALHSVGVGVSVLDGLIRLDVARGLADPEGTRVDFYLDAPL